MSTEVGTWVAPTPVALPDVDTLIQQVIVQPGGIDAIERLVALQERVMTQRAESAMTIALSEFSRLCPPIAKSKQGGFFVDTEGTKHVWFYTPLDEIVRAVKTLCYNLGLNYAWDVVGAEDALTVTCTLRHIDGASRSSTMKLPITGTSKMTPAQKWSGTATFGKRLTLSNVLGITTMDDVDSLKTGGGDDTLTDEEAEALSELVAEVLVDTPEKSAAERIAMFLAFLGVRAINDLPRSRLEAARRSLEEKRRRGA